MLLHEYTEMYEIINITDCGESSVIEIISINLVANLVRFDRFRQNSISTKLGFKNKISNI